MHQKLRLFFLTKLEKRVLRQANTKEHPQTPLFISYMVRVERKRQNYETEASLTSEA